MQRFWEFADITSQPGGWGVMLDGKPMRLPGGGPLVVASRPLAQAIAAEWQAAGGSKGGSMGPHHVPLTGLAGTAQNHIAADPAATVSAIAAYGETDLLCYRATEPDALIRRQAAAWQPWLDWSARVLDAPLKTSSAIIHVAQDADALAALRCAVERQDVPALAALGVIVPTLGSLVLGLAVAAEALDVAAALDISTVDEQFQAEFWGEDAEAADRRRKIAADLNAAERFLRLTRPSRAMKAP
jgi:chaperone required for assembly of F1-ATPase